MHLEPEQILVIAMFASFIVLLFSFYFAALVVLLGAQFSKVWSDRRQA